MEEHWEQPVEQFVHTLFKECIDPGQSTTHDSSYRENGSEHSSHTESDIHEVQFYSHS